MLEKQERLSDLLPAVSVTPDVAKRIKALAKQENVKIAVVIRSALQLLLSEYDSLTFDKK